jgi:probable rRNA maturation factor
VSRPAPGPTLSLLTSRIGSPPRGPARARLLTVLSAAARLSGVRTALHVDVVWSDDAEMKRLNKRHTGSGCVTDVLAFAEDMLDPELGMKRLGEVVCNLDLARRSARANGNRYEAEVILYATHGVVHLLGGDDHTPAGRRAMRRIELAALAEGGLEVRGG